MITLNSIKSLQFSNIMLHISGWGKRGLKKYPKPLIKKTKKMNF